MPPIQWFISLVLLFTATTTLSAAERILLKIPSSIDQEMQSCYLITPDDYRADGPPRPMLVMLHSWSGDVEQRNPQFEQAANRRGWLYLFPNFRGRNDHPEACGSPLAQQDILDATAHVLKRWPIDPRRVYLAGSSGGGHMTLLMAGRHPQPWAAASGWVPISDLSAWYTRHASGNYGAMMRASCGGPFGASAEIDAQYRARSPLTHLAGVGRLPLDIAAGVHDGHQGSVPIRHSLEAFNVVARSLQAEVISDAEIEQISRPMGRLEKPRPSDTVEDPSYRRAIYLRRTAGESRVTIFEGGHEGIGEAACAFLERHVRPE